MSYTAKAEATAVLAGYVSTHPNREQDLTDAAKWRKAAEVELEARGLGVVKALSEDTLKAIVNGEIDMPAIYAAALERPFEIISVSLDERSSYKAYSCGEEWNGFQCPYFTFEEAMKITEHPDLKGLTYDAQKDQFSFADPECLDDPTYKAENFEAKAITVDGKQIKVYAVGAFFWCWYKD